MSTATAANLMGITGIARRLVMDGALDEAVARKAMDAATAEKSPLAAYLVQHRLASPAALAAANSVEFGMPIVDALALDPAQSAITLVKEDLLRKHQVLPLYKRGNRLFVGTSDPTNNQALEELKFHTNLAVEPILVDADRIKRCLDLWLEAAEALAADMDDADGLEGLEVSGGDDDFSNDSGVDASGEDTPTVKFINKALVDAIRKGASDIHFEPEQSFLRIRYRIDGILRQIRSLHKSYWPAMAVRLKVMSNMNIAEARAPQDGRIGIKFSGRQIDFRASAQPTTHGENFVLRVLDRQKGIVPLDALGLAETELNLLKLMIARPDGVILVTGPTGSGKTTTLYSILNHINTESVNIMTLEDPVEYPMNMIRQTSVNESVKLGFADGIRSMMRQDPDIILVGEIRDRETAEMAFAAAMTGHQVYSTLHTSSAIGSVSRLLDIGILPDIMAGNIIGIVAQRLVRRLCPHCKESVIADEVERRLLGLVSDDAEVSICRTVGCERCAHQGYKGRLAIMEILKMTAELDELTARRASSRELKNAARAAGFKALVDDGMRRVREGVTTLEEVARVVDLTDRLV